MFYHLNIIIIFDRFILLICIFEYIYDYLETIITYKYFLNRCNLSDEKKNVISEMRHLISISYILCLFMIIWFLIIIFVIIYLIKNYY